VCLDVLQEITRNQTVMDWEQDVTKNSPNDWQLKLIEEERFVD